MTGSEPDRYDLTLFVSGASALSTHAVTDVQAFCELHLRDRYQLRVIDIYREPEEVIARGVLAAPALIKDSPPPRRVMVGDLSDPAKMLALLDLAEAAGPAPGLGGGHGPGER